MVLGLGCDIVEVIRLEKWLDNEKLQTRYFTKQELSYIQGINRQVAMERLAGMFAVKEAYTKSIMHTVNFTDIIIERNELGAPRLRLERFALKRLTQHGATYALASISHEKQFAIGMVVIGC